MHLGVFDDMGRKLILPQPIRRVVSLVPSDTETLCRLGLGDRLVGITNYCVEPAAELEGVMRVGGTKDPDVDAITHLGPDLILANQEENSRAGLEALANRGLRVFVSFPKRYADALSHLARLAKYFGAQEAAGPLVNEGYKAVIHPPRSLRVFVPVWRDPLMTFSDGTYASDLLRMAGVDNLFAERERRYPLKADLGMRSPLPADQVANRDKRYPRISEEELVKRAPECILLPSEPFEFGENDVSYFRSLDIPAAQNGQIHCVDGMDLFWPGARSVEALPRLNSFFDSL